jgi:hypothetical protein
MFTVYLARTDTTVTVATREQAIWQQKRELWVAQWNNTIRAQKNTIGAMYGYRIVTSALLLMT